jgi:hypothetical protein
LRGCRVVVFLAGALLAEVFASSSWRCSRCCRRAVLAVLAVLAVRYARSSTWSSSRPPRACAERRLLRGSAPLRGCRLARGRLPGGRLLGRRRDSRLGRRDVVHALRGLGGGERGLGLRQLALALLVRLQLLGQLALGQQAILLDGTRQVLGLLGPLSSAASPSSRPT